MNDASKRRLRDSLGPTAARGHHSFWRYSRRSTWRGNGGAQP